MTKNKKTLNLSVGPLGKSEKFCNDFTINMTRTVILQQLIEQIEELQKTIDDGTGAEVTVAKILLKEVETQIESLLETNEILGAEQ